MLSSPRRSAVSRCRTSYAALSTGERSSISVNTAIPWYGGGVGPMIRTFRRRRSAPSRLVSPPSREPHGAPEPLPVRGLSEPPRRYRQSPEQSQEHTHGAAPHRPLLNATAAASASDTSATVARPSSTSTGA